MRREFNAELLKKKPVVIGRTDSNRLFLYNYYVVNSAQNYSFHTYRRLPLTRVTPHCVRRCHEVTEVTAAVSGCRVKRD